MTQRSTHLRSILLTSSMLALSTLPVLAQEPVAAKHDAEEDIWTQDQLLGTMGGVRPWLNNYGVTMSLSEVNEVLGNTSGGIKRGAEYDGLTTLDMQWDTSKAWKGGLFNVSGMNIHGRNLSTHHLQTLQTASGIEADNGFRLWEAWYQQTIIPDKLDLRIGQQSFDQEYLVSQNALLFVNTAFGWPMTPSADMLGGGTAYPLSALGARAKWQPADHWTLLGGIYNDNPSGLGPTEAADPQRLNEHGTNFRLQDKPLLIGEAQYGVGTSAEDVKKSGGKAGLPGTYKLGGWYDFGKFADKRYGTDGQSLAVGNGIARLHDGDYSIYAVADQFIWRTAADKDNGVSVFFRGMGAPDDRSLVTYSVNTGLTYHGPFGRDSDTAGLGLGYAKVSDDTRDLQADQGSAIRQGGETFLEATYQYAVAPWWSLQPDLQYVFNPGAGVAEPYNANKRVGDETVIGLRTTLAF